MMMTAVVVVVPHDIHTPMSCWWMVLKEVNALDFSILVTNATSQASSLIKATSEWLH